MGSDLDECWRRRFSLSWFGHQSWFVIPPAAGWGKGHLTSFDMASLSTLNLNIEWMGDELSGSLRPILAYVVFQHASVSYVAPVGRGLRFDFGKFVTRI